jgi:hypothetical protein
MTASRTRVGLNKLLGVAPREPSSMRALPSGIFSVRFAFLASAPELPPEPGLSSAPGETSARLRHTRVNEPLGVAPREPILCALPLASTPSGSSSWLPSWSCPQNLASRTYPAKRLPPLAHTGEQNLRGYPPRDYSVTRAQSSIDATCHRSRVAPLPKPPGATPNSVSRRGIRVPHPPSSETEASSGGDKPRSNRK